MGLGGITSGLSSAYRSISSGLGSVLNDATGASSAARQSQKYALQSMSVNNKYQKEFAKNAHQWEVQDLKKAGLNPVLSAGGSGTGASGGGVMAGSESQSGLNPISVALEAWNGAETALNTSAETDKVEAEVENIDQDTVLKRWQTLTEMEKGPLTREERKKIQAEKEQILKMTPELVEKTRAETKYTNERARGFTESKQYGLDVGGEGGVSWKGFNAGGHAGGNYSTSKTW